MTLSFNISILIREYGKPSGKLSPDDRMQAFDAAKAVLENWLGESDFPTALLGISVDDLRSTPLGESSALRAKVIQLVTLNAHRLPGGLKDAALKDSDPEQQLADGCVFVPTPPTPPPPAGYWDCSGNQLTLDTYLGIAKVDGQWKEVPADRAETQFSFALKLTPVALVPKA